MENNAVFLKVGKLNLRTETDKCVVMYAGRSNHNESDMVVVYNLKDISTNKLYKVVIYTQLDRPGKEIAEILERELITSADSSLLDIQFQVGLSGYTNMTLDKHFKDYSKKQLFSYIISCCNVVEDK